MNNKVISRYLYIVLCLIPFFYLDIFGVKIIAIVSFVMILFFLNSKFPKKYFYSLNFALITFFILYTLFLSLVGGEYNILFATCVFFILYFWSNIGNLKINPLKLKSLYLYSCVFCALGVFLQVIVYKLVGGVIFRHDEFLNRLAFSFIWLDYSFISLFIVSGIPVAIKYKEKSYLLSFFLVFILVVGSVLTSARTGVFALVFSFLIIQLFILLKNINSLKINRINLYFVIFVFISAGLIPIIFNKIAGRDFDLGGSGRAEDFLEALMFLKNNIFFGAYLNQEIYYTEVATIPHNMFLYTLSLGGIFYFSIFILLLSNIFFKIKSSDDDTLEMILICFVGFQLIPSIFSAYFFAVLLGIANVECKLKRK